MPTHKSEHLGRNVAPFSTWPHLSPIVYLQWRDKKWFICLTKQIYAPTTLVTKEFFRERNFKKEAASRTKGLEDSGHHQHLGFLKHAEDIGCLGDYHVEGGGGDPLWRL